MTLYHIVCVLSLAEGSGESANDSSCEEEMIAIKHKPLQVRHSLLDKLDEASIKATSDPPKRQKREDNMVSHVTVVWFVM